MEHLTTDEVQARLIEWQRVASDSSMASHLRRTARTAVKRFRAELAARQS